MTEGTQQQLKPGIRLAIPQEPERIDLIPGFLWVEAKPVGYVEQAAAKAFAARMIAELGAGEDAIEDAGGEVEGLPAKDDPDRTKALEDLYFAMGMARQLITAWGGFDDQGARVAAGGPLDESGEPAPVTPENIDALIRDTPYIGEMFMQKVQAAMYLRLLEGGRSPAPSSGPSAGPTAPETRVAGNTAETAGGSTGPAVEASEGQTGDGAPSTSTGPNPSKGSSSSS